MKMGDLRGIEQRHAALPDQWDYSTVPSPEELQQIDTDERHLIAEVHRLRELVQYAYNEGHRHGCDYGIGTVRQMWEMSETRTLRTA